MFKLDSKLLLAKVAQESPLPPQQERMLATITSAHFRRPRLEATSPFSQVATYEQPLPLVSVPQRSDPLQYSAVYCKLQSEATAIAEHFAIEAIRNTYNFYHNTNTSEFDHTNIGHDANSRIIRAVLRLLLYAKTHELRYNSSSQVATAFFLQMQE